jgi:hypothetical protein
MADATCRRYLFVAIDRATRWVFAAIKNNKSAPRSRAFLPAPHKACPIKITKLLIDNDKEFTAPFVCLACTTAEQFNGRISHVYTPHRSTLD